MIIPLYSLIYFKISSYPQAIQYMLLFFLTIALGYDLPDLVSCLTLVKSKIDRDESSFDTMLSTSTLHPESLIDKIVADMLESCASQITPSISQEITPVSIQKGSLASYLSNQSNNSMQISKTKLVQYQLDFK